MLTKQLALALLGSALASAPALAQANPPANPISPPAAPARTAPAQVQPVPAQGMSTGNWLTQEQPGQWRASKLKGLNVYNANNEKIGDINELLVDSSGNVQAVVIGVGGFLGMGEHDVAVPFDEIKFMNEPRARATTAMNTPNAPAPAAGQPAPAQNPPTTTGAITPAERSAGDMTRSAPDHALLNMTKDQLKSAPEFKYTR